MPHPNDGAFFISRGGDGTGYTGISLCQTKRLRPRPNPHGGQIVTHICCANALKMSEEYMAEFLPTI